MYPTAAERIDKVDEFWELPEIVSRYLTVRKVWLVNPNYGGHMGCAAMYV